MKKFSIVGHDNEKVKQIFINKGYVFDEKKPEFVISYGGDGTLLKSEHLYPSISKLFIKNTKIGKLAQKKENDEIISSFILGKYNIKKIKKIEVVINGEEKIIGTAEITLHNADPRNAIRYKVRIDNEDIHHELIGDGIIVCNSTGSTGYYRSITDSYFEVGIGLAFNNSTEQSDHIVLNNSRHIFITLTRGPAIIFGDNQEKFFNLKDGDSIEFFESKKALNLIEVH